MWSYLFFYHSSFCLEAKDEIDIHFASSNLVLSYSLIAVFFPLKSMPFSFINPYFLFLVHVTWQPLALLFVDNFGTWIKVFTPTMNMDNFYAHLYLLKSLLGKINSRTSYIPRSFYPISSLHIHSQVLEELSIIIALFFTPFKTITI